MSGHSLSSPPASQLQFIPATTYKGSKDGYMFKMGSMGLGYYFDQMQTRKPSSAPTMEDAHVPVNPSTPPSTPPASQLPFIRATAFEGSKYGYVFKMGSMGLGYYFDQMQTRKPSSAPTMEDAHVPVNASTPSSPPSASQLPFIRATAFEGSKDGYVFKMGTLGLGYYYDQTQTSTPSPAPAVNDAHASANPSTATSTPPSASTTTSASQIPFIPAATFQGSKDGYMFHKGSLGLGYYYDKTQVKTPSPASTGKDAPKSSGPSTKVADAAAGGNPSVPPLPPAANPGASTSTIPPATPAATHAAAAAAAAASAAHGASASSALLLAECDNFLQQAAGTMTVQLQTLQAQLDAALAADDFELVASLGVKQKALHRGSTQLPLSQEERLALPARRAILVQRVTAMCRDLAKAEEFTNLASFSAKLKALKALDLDSPGDDDSALDPVLPDGKSRLALDDEDDSDNYELDPVMPGSLSGAASAGGDDGDNTLDPVLPDAVKVVSLLSYDDDNTLDPVMPVEFGVSK